MPTTKLESLVLVSKQNGFVIIPAATPLTRLNYFDGKFLRAGDLKAEQDYLRQLVAQSNQAGGSGVAHGFDLSLGGGDTLEIGAGLAIDPSGRVLLLPQGAAIGVQQLIDKSRDLQKRFGRVNVVREGSFERCELEDNAPLPGTTQGDNLYLIVISPAEALCGEEDVYGKLCEEACATSTDRPFAVEGLTVRAIPLVLQTPLPSPKAVALTQAHLRSRVASAYFEDERRRVASLISAFGLQQETWCLGSDAAGGSGVPIGVIARAGSSTVFLDPWIARRERIDAPGRRYWQWRMMMRPWDVFLAQVLQFQCQLSDLIRKAPVPNGDVDLCGGARGVIRDAADTISELKQFYQDTAQRFTTLNVNLEEAITFKGGVSRLMALNDKLVSVGEGLSVPKDRFLINGGIVELPSAGYLPTVPGGASTINQQVRRLMGEGLDLRFCVVRPDYVAHALEEAQHMERISLLQGLDDPKNKPEVDILVPNGEILEQKQLSPGNGFEASVDLNQALFQPVSFKLANLQQQARTMNFRGAARAEVLATGGGAFYLSCDHKDNLFSQQIIDTVNLARGPVDSAVKLDTAFSQVRVPPRFGLWISLRCESNVLKLGRGDTTNFNARAIVASSAVNLPLFDLEFNGVFQVTQEARITGTAQTVIGHVENAQLSLRSVSLGTASERITRSVDLDITAILTAGSAIEVRLGLGQENLVLSAGWDNDPLTVSADITQSVNVASRTTVPITFTHAELIEKADVLSAQNASHIQALAALEVIAKTLSDTNFADAKARLLFPPPPKPTDELLVRGTTDWVLFHRRRTKRCSEERLAPPPPPSRRYQVFEILAENIREGERLIEEIRAGKIPTNRLKPVALVEFEAGVATLLTRTAELLTDWQAVTPGNTIVYGMIANGESAAADGETLARSRLDRLESALDPISKLSPQAQDDFLSTVPTSTPVVGADGAIILLTLNQITTSCHLVFRVNQGQRMDSVQNFVKAGDLNSAIGQFTQPVGAVTFNAGTVTVPDNSAQALAARWQQLGGGQISQAIVTIFPPDLTVPAAIALSQSRVIEQMLDPAAGAAAPVPVQVPSPNAFPAVATCPAITFVSTAISRRAAVLFASLDGSHFPAREAKRATVQFDDAVPRGDELNILIRSLTPNEPVNGVMVATLEQPDSGATARATAVANAVMALRPNTRVTSRAGVLTPDDRRRVEAVGISLAGIDEVIFLEPNPPRT